MKKITVREIIKATGAQMIALGDMDAALNKNNRRLSTSFPTCVTKYRAKVIWNIHSWKTK